MAFFVALPFIYTGGNYDYIMHICIIGFFFILFMSIAKFLRLPFLHQIDFMSVESD